MELAALKAGDIACGYMKIGIIQASSRADKNELMFCTVKKYAPCDSGKEKIFRRWNKREIRYVKQIP